MTDTVQPIVPVRVSDWRDRRMAELEEQLEQAQAENAALKAEIARLKQRIAEFERAAKRQATPFARDEHKADPKRPGRKVGQGLFSYRAHPTPDEVDETKEARLDRCPECGGAEAHSILASILVTCRQRALSTVDFLVRLQRATGGAIPSLVPAPPLDTS